MDEEEKAILASAIFSDDFTVLKYCSSCFLLSFLYNKIKKLIDENPTLYQPDNIYELCCDNFLEKIYI